MQNKYSDGSQNNTVKMKNRKKEADQKTGQAKGRRIKVWRLKW